MVFHVALYVGKSRENPNSVFFLFRIKQFSSTSFDSFGAWGVIVSSTQITLAQIFQRPDIQKRIVSDLKRCSDTEALILIIFTKKITQNYFGLGAVSKIIRNGGADSM